MSKVFEIFNAVNGATHGFRFGESRTRETLSRLDTVNIPGVVYDFLPAREGFYVLDIRDNVKAGPFPCRSDAQNFADYENQASDYNSFRVIEQEF